MQHHTKRKPESTTLIPDLLNKFMNEFINPDPDRDLNEFLNHFRVRYCEELIQKGLITRPDLKSLAHQCGFLNQNTLTTTFKKYTGFSLSRYHRGWKKLLSAEVYD
jgi:YesN/AraC family two-component response regulator